MPPRLEDVNGAQVAPVGTSFVRRPAPCCPVVVARLTPCVRPPLQDEDDGEEAAAATRPEPVLDPSKHKSGIVPTLQCVPLPGVLLVVPPDPPHLLVHARRNLVATVNLDCKLDLKTITLHARNAEYNPKVRRPGVCCPAQPRAPRPHARPCPAALRGGHHAHPRAQDDGTHLRQWQAGARPLWLGVSTAPRPVCSHVTPSPRRAPGVHRRQDRTDGQACGAQVLPGHSEAGLPRSVQGACAQGSCLTDARVTHPLTPSPPQDFTVQNIVASADVKFPIKLEGLAFAHAMFANYEPELFPGLIYRMKVPKVVLLIFVSGKVVLTGAKVRRRGLETETHLSLAIDIPLNLADTRRRVHRL
jgi:TATA-box binding protein (TBP) (component of TFIID and TFIIIB)